MEACVRCTKYRPSPIPSGGLEIPIVLVIKKEDSTEGTFEKTEDLLLKVTTLNRIKLLLKINR